MTRTRVVFAAVLACATAFYASPAMARSVSSVRVSVGGQTVTGLVRGTRGTRGTRVPLVRACPREVFFGADGIGATAPHVSPNGRYVVLERLWPYEARGRVDESTVLYDATTGRSYASTAYGRIFQTGTPIVTTWVAGRPATLAVRGEDATRHIDLPGPLANASAPDRCSPR